MTRLRTLSATTSAKRPLVHCLLLTGMLGVLACGSDVSEPPVAEDCSAANCGDHGSCDIETSACVCDTGYAGNDCQSCDDGWQDNNGDGVCELDCATNDCSGHGSCDDGTGEPTCLCDPGFVGAECAECDEGLQDNDDDGVCEADCGAVECTNGTCDDSSGLAECGCDAGFKGPDCDTLACGDGVLDDGEACDDGNTDALDGCSSDCLSDETCGNGVVDPTEQCDDGNNTLADDCPDGASGTCMPASCEDGHWHSEQSGDEEFTDCGGSCPTNCASGLLISEYVTRPLPAEFIEIHNPGPKPIDLTNVHLADHVDYFDPASVVESTDFRVQFPAGTTLDAGAYLVVSLDGGSAFETTYGAPPDYDFDPTDMAAPALVGNYTGPLLSNGGEMMVLYHWDGASDLVQDIDYIRYGSFAGMDKTGVTIGSSTYLPETPTANQFGGPAPGPNAAVERCDFTEPAESISGGNGMLGHDETSEDFSQSLAVALFPTPGSDNSCGECLGNVLGSTASMTNPTSYGGTETSFSPTLGDLDGDGDLDVFACTVSGSPHQLWLNDGAGNLTDMVFAAGSTDNCRDTRLGDLDGDFDLDIYVASRNTTDVIYFNDGAGNFTAGAQTLSTSNGYGMALGDVDGDLDLDVVIGVAGSGASELWLNDGTGTFTNSGQVLGTQNTLSVALGDLDGDLDLDIYFGTFGAADTVWLNDGAGNFTDTLQALGGTARDVVLGDVDGDLDLDAFIANNGGANRVWINDGAGVFSAGQTLGNSESYGVDMADLDGDGDLDAFVTNNSAQADLVWLNDGTGTFVDSGQALGSSNSRMVVLGDLNGDCINDAFVAADGNEILYIGQ